jgi:LmbE family N-acetylglucosaminyl deacetylase
MTRQYFTLFLLLSFFTKLQAQTPISYSSADILQQIKKLEVFGSVLYVAAHPDDENTRLLGYLANERKFRTGYLSLTRGDGGQNLIGDEQAVDLGLIRTQELLSARRIDGAEQFFTRAYDFGYSKNPEEAMKIWEHDKILADVVWVIRKFKPDVIITRFPTTGEGGHGHHTASAILAGEAYDAAADATKFPEQLKYVTTWQAKRLLWNTFNFGGNSTQREDQFKIDCGVYNPILGKSYGEIAAESRSRHKSQGFGVPAQRGKNIEYFATIKGDKPVKDLMEGLDSMKYKSKEFTDYFKKLDGIIKNFSYTKPQNSIGDLGGLCLNLVDLKGYEKDDKQILLQKIIAQCAGLFMEVTAINQTNTIGDSIKLKFSFINRTGVNISEVIVNVFNQKYNFKNLVKNENEEFVKTIKIDEKTAASQPYFLVDKMSTGSYNASLTDISKPQNNDYNANFEVTIEGSRYGYEVPIMYKYTDPVKGELYEPIQIVSPAFINVTPNLLIFSNDKKNEKKTLQYTVQSNLGLNEKVKFYSTINKESKLIFDSTLSIVKMAKGNIATTLNGNDFGNNTTTSVGGELVAPSMYEHQYTSLKKISYDHIPDIFYNYQDRVKVLKIDLKTVGSKAGYIAGAGDKVPQALEQMGYTVTMLTEKDITTSNIKQFDVIITGVRAYNVHAWLSNVHPVLMQYVNDGGVLLTQYNTNNQLGPVKASMAPYPFTISRNRITDETAKVNFLLPNHPALNYPNKITEKDFDGWIQERSIYNAEKIDSSYKRILSMKDPGEAEQDGSLIVADYGKGKYVYTGLVFFRELPAGVGGAYRLFANLIAKRKL